MYAEDNSNVNVTIVCKYQNPRSSHGDCDLIGDFQALNRDELSCADDNNRRPI